jgi:hypothetical protein
MKKLHIFIQKAIFSYFLSDLEIWKNISIIQTFPFYNFRMEILISDHCVKGSVPWPKY